MPFFSSPIFFTGKSKSCSCQLLGEKKDSILYICWVLFFPAPSGELSSASGLAAFL